MFRRVYNGEIEEIPTWQDRLEHINKDMPSAEHYKRLLSMSDEEKEQYCKDSMAKFEKHWKGSVERLSYYRSHGLVDCFDYPGGDVAFERDVLSGEQREETTFHYDMKREDAYIFKCIEDGSFAVDSDFCKYFRMHPRIELLLEYKCIIIVQGPYDRLDQILSPDSDMYVKD